jgi:two-component system KDP operon response regulator KdpE
MQGKRILVVDDDANVLRIVERALMQAGAQVYTAADGREGLTQFYAHRPDLVILDVMMPDIDGWAVCARLRQLSDVPIMMLTALGSNNLIVQGLRGGADDYVTKPFTIEVLMARVEALLRRAKSSAPPERVDAYRDDYLAIELEQRRVLVRGKPIKLTAKEYQLLTYLLRNAGCVLSAQQILEKIWGWEYRDNLEYLYVYISNLRKKLEKNAKRPRYLLSEPGVGYWFEVQPKPDML